MMIPGSPAPRRWVLYVVLAVSVAGCGGVAPASARAEEPTPTPITTTSAAPRSTPAETLAPAPPATPRPVASPTSTTFESPVYGYALTLPPGSQILNWSPAERPWDGMAKLERAVNPYADRTTVAEGGLYIFGADDESLEGWFGRVEENGTRYHGCTAAENRVDVAIAGIPAVAFTQTCLQGTNMARVALWKDGFGIGVWLGETTTDKLVAVRDRAIELLATLEWPAS